MRRQGETIFIIPVVFIMIICLILLSTFIADSERQSQRITIEGVVEKVEMFDVPISNTTRTQEKTKIYFVDGRRKEFFGIPDKPINKDKYTVIIYNGNSGLVEVKEKGAQP